MGERAFDVDLDRLRRRRTVKWSLYGPDVLAAWVAEMDFDVAPEVVGAIRAAVDREDFGYPEADLSALSAACATFLTERHDWQVSPHRIFPVADVLAGIGGALDLHVPAGAPVVLPTPAYPPLFEVIELSGRAVAPVPMVVEADRFVLDLERIDGALAAGAGAVLLTSPHNPTGRVFGVAELEALSQVVEHHGARVISDEVHAPLVPPGHRHIPYATVGPAAAHHAVTITSTSKAWNLAGLRCAQVIASHHDDAARWRSRSVFQVAAPTPLGVAASTAAYGEGVQWLDSLLAYLDRSRTLLGDLLADELPSVRYREPEGTYLAWLDCSELGLVDPARTFLDLGGVALSDGPPFGTGNDAMVRLNFATSHELLERIVVQMGAAVRSSGRGGS